MGARVRVCARSCEMLLRLCMYVCTCVCVCVVVLRVRARSCECVLCASVCCVRVCKREIACDSQQRRTGKLNPIT